LRLKICFFVLQWCFPGLLLWSQDTIVTFDQPGYSTAAFIIPRQSLQFEFGTSYNKITGLNETFFPSLMVRIPVLKKAELRLTLNYEPQSNIFILDDVEHGHDPVAVGFKYKIVNQRDWLPSLVFMGNAFYPVQRFDPFLSSELNGDAWLIAHNFIGEKHELFYSAGYIRGNTRLKDILSWTFCYNYMITDNIGIFGEYFGFQYFESGRHEFGFDAGATYEFGNRFQLDICYYYNIDAVQKMGYFSGGISYSLSHAKQ
jgi:hypothetical protein